MIVLPDSVLTPRPGYHLVALVNRNGRVMIREHVGETEMGWIVKRYGDEPSEERWREADWPHPLCVGIAVQ